MPQGEPILNVRGALKWTGGLKSKPSRVACPFKRCRRQPSPPTITAGGSDFVVETASPSRWEAAQCTEINPVGLAPALTMY